jgi:putative transposase
MWKSHLTVNQDRETEHGQRDPERGGLPKLLSPPRRRQVVDEVREKLGVSERWACRVLGQPRSTQRRQPYVPEDGPRLVAQMIELASEYGRYGYRRITALLRHDGWKVNHKRIERLWRREGLKVPKKQPKRGRSVSLSSRHRFSASR